MKQKERRLVLVLAIIMIMSTLCIVACKPEENQNDGFDYNALYETQPSAPYPIVKAGKTNKANFGYTLKEEQGYNGWYYMYEAKGVLAQMTFDNKSNCWKSGKASISGGVLYSSQNNGVARQYRVDFDGKATVYGNFKSNIANDSIAFVSVLHNNEIIYEKQIDGKDLSGYYFEKVVQVTKGETLSFVVKGDNAQIFINPTITYSQSQNESLYRLAPINKYYGDVFPYYDYENKKMYMWYLWSDNAALGNNYHYTLDVSTNLFNYTNYPEENNFDVYDYYNRNYRFNSVMNVNLYNDYNKYKFGIRDNFLYFDKENKRYLLIAGSYKQFDSNNQISDLTIRASDDEYALSWSKPASIVDSYSRNLPECPSLYKIGDRWYVFVSVAYVTAHQVGPLQYWTGDKGVDVMDVNWQNKDFQFLDGEDLCAARVTPVGEKFYMWGWIPRTYDTMPWAPWGGYLNLPREVVQHSDGTLGGRLDPALQQRLNSGKIFVLNNDNYTAISGNCILENNEMKLNGTNNSVKLNGDYSHNYINFSVDMKNSESVGYIMKQGNKQYQVLLTKDSKYTYMKVLSPNDNNHKVNSSIVIGSSEQTKFQVKIVNDGEFVEFFVNDSYALTAHTAMSSGNYEAYLYSDKSATFTDFTINKLTSFFDIGY